MGGRKRGKETYWRAQQKDVNPRRTHLGRRGVLGPRDTFLSSPRDPVSSRHRT